MAVIAENGCITLLIAIALSIFIALSIVIADLIRNPWMPERVRRYIGD